MRYFALATDFDETLTTEGRVTEATWVSLENLKRSGRMLILVTGRETEDLLSFLPRQELFDRIVTENGAVICNPAKKSMKPLADPPPPKFVATLRSRGVNPLSAGHVIVSTLEPWQDTVIEAIRDLGLELQVIFNKGAVMVLPTGVNKATGLRYALEELGLSTHNTVATGDAENDHAFLVACECGVAVANALPSLKERADWITTGARGQGVEEVIDELLREDMHRISSLHARDFLTIGKDLTGDDAKIPAYGATILIAGGSGGGKSTLTTTILEALVNADYQFCVIDPEGDYQSFPHAVVIGDAKRSPGSDEILAVIERPGRSVIVNLLGVNLDDRPIFFADVQLKLEELRNRSGRPNWLILDEAHHVLPTEADPPAPLGTGLLVTHEPESLPKSVLQSVTHLIVVGENPSATFAQFCSSAGRTAPRLSEGDLPSGDALLWRCDDASVVRFEVLAPTVPRVRHSRKYAIAELTPDRSFYFRGPEGKLNLRAPNLVTFSRLSEGVDDETWNFHLRKGEYSSWFRDNIKNEELAQEAAAVEENQALSPGESRQAIRDLIDERYTL